MYPGIAVFAAPSAIPSKFARLGRMPATAPATWLLCSLPYGLAIFPKVINSGHLDEKPNEESQI